MVWDVKSLLEGKSAVIYQKREVLFPSQGEHAERLCKHLGPGLLFARFCVSLHVTVVLVQDSTQNCSEFPECWFVFPHPCNKGSQAKGFFLHVPQRLMITLNSQGAGGYPASHMWL